jgi:hypothetical protein
MAEKKTLERASEDKRQDKAATTQAGEFVREEIEHIRGKVLSLRSRAIEGAFKRESHAAVSKSALSAQGRSAAARRTQGERSAAARKAVKTEGAEGRSAAALKSRTHALQSAQQ